MEKICDRRSMFAQNLRAAKPVLQISQQDSNFHQNLNLVQFE